MADADERLIVMLEARISEFERRMRQAEQTGTRTYQGLARGSRSATRQMEADALRAASRINQAFASVSSSIGAFGRAFVGAVAIGTLARFVSSARQTVRAVADIADQAARVGASAEDFQALQNGLKLSGVEAAEASRALENFTQRLGEALEGNGDLARRFSDAGISLTDSNGNLRDTMTLLREYADIVARAGTPGEQMALAVDAFGKGGKAMVLALREGRDGINAMMEEARSAGTVMTDEAVAQAAILDDRWDQLTMKVQTLWRTALLGAFDYFNLVRSAGEEEEDAALSAARTLAYVQEDAIRQVETAVRALAAEIPGLLDIGADEAALALDAVASQMTDLSAKFADGSISAQEFGDAIDDAADEATNLLVQAQNVNGLDMSAAVGAVGSLTAALQVATGWAAELAATLPGEVVSTGPTTMEEDARGRNAFTPYAGAPRVRPRPAPNNIDFGYSGGAGGGGGGGGGAGRIDALIEDLQTEREVLTIWYEESLVMLQSASDAELEVLGGKQEAIERLEAEHMERLRAIRDEGQSSQLQDMAGFFGSLASVAEAGGKRSLKIAAALQGAQGIMNAWTAYTEMLKDPSFVGRPWARYAAAANILAAGMKAVSSIRAAGRGAGAEGGATSSPGASGAGGGQTEAPQSRLIVQGLRANDIFTGQMIYDIFMGEAKLRGAPIIELLR